VSQDFPGHLRLGAALVFALTIAADLFASPHGAESLDFRTGWRFAKGEQPGAEAPECDDATWAVVRLPHDWAIAGPFNPDENGATGKLPWRGVGWYRKSFTLDRELGVSFQSAIPSGIRERLQHRGYDVQSKRRYAPLWLENGQPMIVPVEDTKIVPVGHNVY